MQFGAATFGGVPFAGDEAIDPNLDSLVEVSISALAAASLLIAASSSVMVSVGPTTSGAVTLLASATAEASVIPSSTVGVVVAAATDREVAITPTAAARVSLGAESIVRVAVGGITIAKLALIDGCPPLQPSHPTLPTGAAGVVLTPAAGASATVRGARPCGPTTPDPEFG